jgi:hypothetical protein
LLGVAPADDLCRRFKEADDFSFRMRVAAQHTRPCLLDHLFDPGRHAFQLFLDSLQRGLLQHIGGTFHSFRNVLDKALRLPHHSHSRCQQFLVQTLHPLLSLLAFAAAGARNLHHAQLNTARPVAQLRPHFAGHFRGPLHQTRQHTHPVSQQATVGRIVNVGFHHGGIHSQFAALDDLLLLCDRHQPPMQLFHRFGPQLPRQPAQRLIVRNFSAANACELPLDEIGTHLPVQLIKAPVEHVLERQQSQHNLGWRAFPTAGLALLTAFG